MAPLPTDIRKALAFTLHEHELASIERWTNGGDDDWTVDGYLAEFETRVRERQRPGDCGERLDGAWG